MALTVRPARPQASAPGPGVIPDPAVGATAIEDAADDGVTVGIIALIRQVLGQPGAQIDPASRLEEQLGLESVDALALGELLRERFGRHVDLPAYLSTLDIDQLIELSVADLADYVRTARHPEVTT